MQSAFQRFRVSGPPPRRRISSAQRQSSASLAEADVNTPARPLTQSACHRCRRLKKKCSPTRQGACRLCLAAALPCSFPKAVQDSREREKELQARITWLSQHINRTLPSDAVPVELVETGKQLPVAPRPVSRESATRDGHSFQGPLSERPLGENVGESCAAFVRQEPSFLLDKITGLRLVDAYFRHLHRAYPFLDRAQVLQDLDRSFKENQQELEVCKIPTRLAVVMAIGHTTLQRASEMGEASLAQFNIPEKEIVHECLCKNDLESVEILILLALYSLFEAEGIPPGVIAGILARKVIAMGLTQDIGPSVAISQVKMERRRRLFWSVYVLDRMISVSYGVPATISDEEINVPLPSISVQEYASPDRYYYAMTLQVNRHVVSLRKLEWSILQTLHLASPHPLNMLKQGMGIDSLSRQIEDWYTHGCLLSSSAMVDNDHIPFHNTITWHNVRYQNLILLLYSPSKLNFQRSVSRAVELEAAAQKYVQSSMILLRQNHLPLNWITLCRFLTLGALFFHCHSCRVRRADTRLASSISHRNNEEAFVRIATAVNLCAQILAFFPEMWQTAKRAAGILQQFSKYITSSEQNTTHGGNAGTAASLVAEDASISQIRMQQFDAASDQDDLEQQPQIETSPPGTLQYEQQSLNLYFIRSHFKELIQSTLGETSLYVHAVWDELSPDDLFQGTMGSDLSHHDTQGNSFLEDQVFPQPDVSVGESGLDMNNSWLQTIDEFGLGIF